MAHELEQVINKLNEAKQAAHTEAKKHLAPMLQEFLVSNPTIKSIGWAQYTPFFNDGETCEFGVHEIRFSWTDQEEYDYESFQTHGFGTWSTFQSFKEYEEEAIKAGIDENTYDAAVKLDGLLHQAEELLHEIFGDHVSVLVNSKGVHVVEFEHD